MQQGEIPPRYLLTREVRMFCVRWKSEASGKEPTLEKHLVLLVNVRGCDIEKYVFNIPNTGFKTVQMALITHVLIPGLLVLK